MAVFIFIWFLVSRLRLWSRLNNSCKTFLFCKLKKLKFQHHSSFVGHFLIAKILQTASSQQTDETYRCIEKINNSTLYDSKALNHNHPCVPNVLAPTYSLRNINCSIQFLNRLRRYFLLLLPSKSSTKNLKLCTTDFYFKD